MNYILPDGKNVDLHKIFEISEIRDYGYDASTVEKSIVQFSIRLKDGTSIPVKRHYHYTDWSTVIKELRKLRLDLYTKWQDYKTSSK